MDFYDTQVIKRGCGEIDNNRDMEFVLFYVHFFTAIPHEL